MTTTTSTTTTTLHSRPALRRPAKLPLEWGPTDDLTKILTLPRRIPSGGDGEMEMVRVAVVNDPLIVNKWMVNNVLIWFNNGLNGVN